MLFCCFFPPCLFSSSCFPGPYLPWKQHFIKASFAGWLRAVFSMEIKGPAAWLIAHSEISEGRNLAAATCSAPLRAAMLVKPGDNYERDGNANQTAQCKPRSRGGFLHSLLAEHCKINNANKLRLVYVSNRLSERIRVIGINASQRSRDSKALCTDFNKKNQF